MQQPFRSFVLAPTYAFVWLLAACGTAEFNTAYPEGECEPNCEAEGVETFDGIATIDLSAQPRVAEFNPGIIYGPDDPIPPGLWHFNEVDTIVTAQTIQAGSEVIVTCMGLDVNGEWRVVRGYETQINAWPATSFGEPSGPSRVLPIVAGDGLVGCAIEELGLIDDTPAELEILPGGPHTAYAEAEFIEVVAGEPLRVDCRFEDELGNEVQPDDYSILTDPSGAQPTVPGTIILERTGRHMVHCDSLGVSESYGDQIEVLPALPAFLSIRKVPLQSIYATHQVVTILSEVTDRFGNPVPTAMVQTVSTPEGNSFGDGRFSYDEDGQYRIDVTVLGETEGGIPLMESEQVIVDGGGPAIRCDAPVDGGWLDANPGDTVTLTGSVADSNGLGDLQVAGDPATLNADGTFSHPITVRYGVNFVDVTASDTFGATNATTCSFLVSNRWANPDELVFDTLMLRLAQSAIDDMSRGGDLNSLGDMLHAVLNSSGLRNTLHQELLGANPLKPNSCDQDACLFGVCVCLFRSGVDYENLRLNGPHDVSLGLESGGLRANATVRGIGVRLDIDGTVNTDGWVNVSHLGVDMSLAVALADGRPRVSVRQVHNVDIGSIDLDFSGIWGFIIDLLEGLVHGLIRDLIRDAIRDFITDSFDDTLDGVLGGLDVSGLGSTFDVPRLDGSGSVPVDFGLGVTRLQMVSSHALFGLGTRFSTMPARPATVPQVPLLPGDPRLEPPSGRPVGATVYMGLLNQVLYALWVGGFFDANLSGLGGLPDGTEVGLNLELPVVTEALGDGRMAVTLGAAHVFVMIPGVFAEPIEVVLGARLETDFSIVGNEFVFGELALTELVFSTPSVSVESDTRDILEDLLRDILQNVVNDTLATALPAIPIPGFEIPGSLSEFGLPAGRELGLVSPSATTTASHILFESAFGLR